MENEKIYGFLQMNHGADHLFLFKESELLKDFEKYKIDPDCLPKKEDDYVCEIDGYPIGGSNSAPAIVSLMQDDEQIKNYLTQKAFGPDYENPTTMDISEYYFQIETDEGCAEEYLEKFGLDRRELEKKAMGGIHYVLEKTDELKLDTTDAYWNLRQNELCVLFEIIDAVNATDFSANDFHPLPENDNVVAAEIKIPKTAAIYLSDKIRIGQELIEESENMYLQIGILCDEPAEELPFGFKITNYVTKKEYSLQNVCSDSDDKAANTEELSRMLNQVIRRKLLEKDMLCGDYL